MKPTDILINEHRIIEQVLNCLERMIERCTAQGRLEREPARDAVAFFRSFAECSPPGQRAAHLFPAMAELECPHGCDSAELVARADVDAHVHLRGMEEVIEEASAGDKKALKRFVQHGQAYVDLLMTYIENEEDRLFPQADRVLDEGQQRILKESLQHDNAESRCGGSHEEFVCSPTGWQIISACPGAHLNRRLDNPFPQEVTDAANRHPDERAPHY